MKYLFLFLSSIIVHYTAICQYTYRLKADSILIHNDSCKAELIIENSTRHVDGFLYNKGNGRTEFRNISINAIKLNDSMYKIGPDTLTFANANSIKNQFLNGQLANFWISGKGRFGSFLTVDSAVNLSPLASDPLSPVNGRLYYNSGLNRFKGYAQGSWYNLLLNGQTDDAYLSKLFLNDHALVAGGKGIDIEIPNYYGAGGLYLGSKSNTRPFISTDGFVSQPVLSVKNNSWFFPSSILEISGATNYFNGPIVKIDISNNNMSYSQTGMDINISKTPDGSNGLLSFGGNIIYGVRSTVSSQVGANPSYTGNFYAFYAKAVKFNDTNSGPVNTYALYADSGDVFVRETLKTDGSQEVKRTVVTTAITLGKGHYYVAADGISGGFTISLPAAATCAGRVYILKKIDSTSNAITVQPSGSETIEGSTSASLSNQWQKISLISTGTAWELL